MTLYARSDLVLVTVSAEAHGGCGQTHTRPVEHGKPAKIWALTCHDCEDFLRHDDLWASTLSKIPETHDEAANREELEKSHARTREDIMVQSLQVLAGNVAGKGEVAQVACVNGHQNPVTAKFCTECGAPVARLEAVSCPDGHESPPGARFCVECGRAVGVLESAPRVPEAVPEAVAEAAFAETAPEPPAAPPKPLPPPPWTPPPAAKAAAAAPPPPSAAPKRVALPSNTKMRGMKRGDLLDLAGKAGVDATGTREQVLNRLIAANNA